MTRLPAPLALLLSAVASLAAPVPKGKEVELFYPTKEGAKRVVVMTLGDTTTEVTETVSQVQTEGGTHTVTVSLDVKRNATFLVSADGLSRRDPQGGDPTPLLKLGVKEGETWEHDAPLTDGSTLKTTYTMGKREEVTVPAGTFQAVRVGSEYVRGGRTRRATTWFAPGVGIVKMESDLGNQKLIQELKEFTPGK